MVSSLRLASWGWRSCPGPVSFAFFVSHKNVRKCCILSLGFCVASSACHSFMRFLRHSPFSLSPCPTCAVQRHNLTANCSVYSQALNILSTFGCRAEMGGRHANYTYLAYNVPAFFHSPSPRWVKKLGFILKLPLLHNATKLVLD